MFIIFFLLYSIFHLSFENQYGVMIDAGSTGSKVIIYEWSDRISKTYDTNITIPITQDDWSTRFENGFTEYLKDPDGLTSHLNKCINFANKFFEIRKISTKIVPIYFYATAGARLLGYTDRKEIMEKVRKFFVETNYLINEENIRIISGEEEAVFGWISANYLKETLYKPKESYGILELGGASLQISVYFPNDLLANRFMFTLNNIKYQMYIHSYLRYGINEYYKLTYEKLIESSQDTNISHPCLPNGYNITYNSGDKNYTLYGSSNSELCSDLMNDILDIELYCHIKPCSFLGVYQPDLDKTQFIAFGAFENVGIVLNKTSIHLLEISAFSVDVCNLTYDELKDKYKDDPYNYEYCLYFTYIVKLFSEGLGFSPPKEILFQSQINNQTISWTMGAMMIEANLIEWKYDIPVETKQNNLVIIILGLLSGFLFILFVYYCCKYQSVTPTKYRQIPSDVI